MRDATDEDGGVPDEPEHERLAALLARAISGGTARSVVVSALCSCLDLVLRKVPDRSAEAVVATLRRWTAGGATSAECLAAAGRGGHGSEITPAHAAFSAASVVAQLTKEVSDEAAASLATGAMMCAATAMAATAHRAGVMPYAAAEREALRTLARLIREHLAAAGEPTRRPERLR